MIKKHLNKIVGLPSFFLAVSFVLLAFVGSVNAQEKSDLLIIQNKGAEGIVVQLLRGQGASIIGEKGDLSTELFDLLGSADLLDLTEKPLFDEREFPKGPLLHRLVFKPVTLAPTQRFFGLIGMIFSSQEFPDGLSAERFRNEIFSNFEAEVDGVAVKGDQLKVRGPAPFNDPKFPFVIYYNYTQVIPTEGSHRLVYRYRNFRTVAGGDDLGEVAGIWEFEFTVMIRRTGSGVE